MTRTVDEYEAAFNSPVSETVGTRRYVIRQLKGREIGTLNGYLRKVARSPEQQFLDSLGIDSFDELEPDEQEHPQVQTNWKLVRRSSKNWKPPTVTDMEGTKILLNTEGGKREFVWVLFSTVDPIPYEETEEIVQELKVKELMGLFEYAMGMDDADPKGQKEVAITRSPKSPIPSSRDPREESSPDTSGRCPSAS